MPEVGKLEGLIELRDKFTPKIKQALDEVDRFEGRINKLGSSIESFSSRIKGAGIKLTLGITAPIIAAGVVISKLAIDTVESENLVKESFQGMTKSAETWSKGLSKSLGLNEFELRKQAASFFLLAENMGRPQKEAFEMSKKLSELANDLESFLNIPVEEATRALQSGLVGNTEALRMLNVFVNETTLRQKAFTDGLIEQDRQLSQSERFLTIYSSILDQTSKAQGDLGRTLESPANQLRRMGTIIKETATRLGISLLPMLQVFLSLLSKVVDAVKFAVDIFIKLPKPIQAIAFGMIGLVAAAGPLIFIMGTLVSVMARSLITFTLFSSLNYVRIALGMSSVATSLTAVKTAAIGFLGSTAGGILSSTLRRIATAAVWLAGKTIVAKVALLGLSVAAVGAAAVVGAKLGRALVETGGKLKNEIADPIDVAVGKVGLLSGGFSLLGDALRAAGRNIATTAGFIGGIFVWLVKMQASMLQLQVLWKGLIFLWNQAAKAAKFLSEGFEILGRHIFKANFETQTQIENNAKIKTALRLSGLEVMNLAQAEKFLADVLNNFANKALKDQIVAEQQRAKDLTERIKQSRVAAIVQAELSNAASEFGLELKDLNEVEKAELLTQFRAIEAMEARTRLMEIVNRLQRETTKLVVDGTVALKNRQKIANDILRGLRAQLALSGLATPLADPRGVRTPIQIETRQEVAQRLLIELQDKLNEKITESRQRQKDFNTALQQAANLAQSLPGIFGSISSQLLSTFASIKSLSGGEGGFLGGISGLFSAGKEAGGGGGILGLIGGVANLVPAIGPLISAGVQIGGLIIKGIGKLFSSAPDLIRDSARDLGATISKELADSIEKSGEPLQLAIAEIFEAGGFESIDRFAEEIGDIFSVLERGEISKPQAIVALEEAVALLLPRLEELGPAGEEQLERIIGAADRLGVEFVGLSELIQGTFATDTMEEFAEAFGKTNEEIRAIGNTLGITIQTNLERTAAGLDLTVQEFNRLGAALEEQLGIPAEKLEEFLKASGLSAQDLAEKLKIDVSGGAKALDDAQQSANKELERGKNLAESLARNIERAARASHNISVPSFPSMPTSGMRHGGEGVVTGPHAFVVEPGVTEFFSFQPRGREGSDGGSDDLMAAMLSELRSIRGEISNQPEVTSRFVAEAVSKLS